MRILLQYPAFYLPLNTFVGSVRGSRSDYPSWSLRRILPNFYKKVLSPTGLSLAAIALVGAASTAAALVIAGFLYLTGKAWYLVFNPWDIETYFDSARWIIEDGRLYREVSSDYPLFANVIFATVRYLANFLYPGINGFYGLWIASAGVVYLLCGVSDCHGHHNARRTRVVGARLDLFCLVSLRHLPSRRHADVAVCNPTLALH